MLLDELVGISILSDWKMVIDKIDFVFFVCLEKWEFNNVRVVIEVVVLKIVNLVNVFIIIKVYGC